MAHLTTSIAQPRQNLFRMDFDKLVSSGMAPSIMTLQNHLNRAGPKTWVEQQGTGYHA